MELQQAAAHITEHLLPREPSREAALLHREAAVHKTGRFIQGPAPLLLKAGLPIQAVAQDLRDRQLTAGPALQDRHPTADPAHQDHLLIADQAAVHHIPVAAGRADHQVLIQVAAGRRAVVLHPTQEAVPVQAVPGRPEVPVQAREDKKQFAPVNPGANFPTFNLIFNRFS